VESLKRSVLEAKKDVAASAFYASLMAALAATDDSADSAADSDGGGGALAGQGSAHSGSRRQNPNSGSRAGGHADEQHIAPREDSRDSSGMLLDRATSDSPMATDTPDTRMHDAASPTPGQPRESTEQTGGGGGGQRSSAAAAQLSQPPASQHPEAAGGRRRLRWRWADVRELVVYGLGSFESGARTPMISAHVQATAKIRPQQRFRRQVRLAPLRISVARPADCAPATSPASTGLRITVVLDESLARRCVACLPWQGRCRGASWRWRCCWRRRPGRASRRHRSCTTQPSQRWVLLPVLL